MINVYRKKVKDIKGNELSVRVSIADTCNYLTYPVRVRLRTNDNPRMILIEKDDGLIKIEDYNNSSKRFEILNEIAAEILNKYNTSISEWEEVDSMNRFNTNW